MKTFKIAANALISNHPTESLRPSPVHTVLKAKTVAEAIHAHSALYPLSDTVLTDIEEQTKVQTRASHAPKLPQAIQTGVCSASSDCNMATIYGIAFRAVKSAISYKMKKMTERPSIMQDNFSQTEPMPAYNQRYMDIITDCKRFSAMLYYGKKFTDSALCNSIAFDYVQEAITGIIAYCNNNALSLDNIAVWYGIYDDTDGILYDICNDIYKNARRAVARVIYHEIRQAMTAKKAIEEADQTARDNMIECSSYHSLGRVLLQTAFIDCLKRYGDDILPRIYDCILQDMCDKDIISKLNISSATLSRKKAQIITICKRHLLEADIFSDDILSISK